jgi:hypothetical protein
VYLLDFYTTQILTSTTVITECISWLIKVTDKRRLIHKMSLTGTYISVITACLSVRARVQLRVL